MISQLELEMPEERRKPGRRVSGIFWIILLNIGIFVADHFFQVVISCAFLLWIYLYVDEIFLMDKRGRKGRRGCPTSMEHPFPSKEKAQEITPSLEPKQRVPKP
jgi:hypothetical protein